MRTALSLALLAVAVLGAHAIASAASLPTASLRVTTATLAATVPVSTCTLAPFADTYADQLNLLTNYGGAATLDVRSFKTLALVPENKRSFVRFDLAGCAIPAGARVTSADLNVYLGTAPGTARTYDVHRITETWTEGGLTWFAPPSASGTATASFTTAAGARTAAVTADVTLFLAGTAANYGWLLKDRAEDGSTDQQGSVNSREAPSQKPSLAVSYYP